MLLLLPAPVSTPVIVAAAAVHVRAVYLGLQHNQLHPHTGVFWAWSLVELLAPHLIMMYLSRKQQAHDAAAAAAAAARPVLQAAAAGTSLSDSDRLVDQGEQGRDKTNASATAAAAVLQSGHAVPSSSNTHLLNKQQQAEQDLLAMQEMSQRQQEQQLGKLSPQQAAPSAGSLLQGAGAGAAGVSEAGHSGTGTSGQGADTRCMGLPASLEPLQPTEWSGSPDLLYKGLVDCGQSCAAAMTSPQLQAGRVVSAAPWSPEQSAGLLMCSSEPLSAGSGLVGHREQDTPGGVTASDASPPQKLPVSKAEDRELQPGQRVLLNQAEGQQLRHKQQQQQQELRVQQEPLQQAVQEQGQQRMLTSGALQVSLTPWFKLM